VREDVDQRVQLAEEDTENYSRKAKDCGVEDGADERVHQGVLERVGRNGSERYSVAHVFGRSMAQLGNRALVCAEAHISH